MSYEIRIKEIWTASNFSEALQSSWTWTVEQDGVNVDAGSIKFGGEVGEREARKAAEKAATLAAKRDSARVVSYEFTPRI